jgi:hypothetical protein
LNAKDRDQLIRNAYACDVSGNLETHKIPDARWDFSHLAVLRIDAPKEFTNKVLSALDEPAAIVGVSSTSTVALFKVIDGGRYDMATFPHFRKEEREEFVLNGKTQGLFTVTSIAQLIDVNSHAWRDGRSPLTVRRDDLPQLFRDTQERVYAELDRLLKEGGHRHGPLIVEKTPFELSVEQAMHERAARAAAGIAEEDPQEAADNQIVAGADVNLRAGDGIFPMLIAEARKRIAARLAARKAAATP